MYRVWGVQAPGGGPVLILGFSLAYSLVVKYRPHLIQEDW